jgi:hypothetical protein
LGGCDFIIEYRRASSVDNLPRLYVEDQAKSECPQALFIYKNLRFSSYLQSNSTRNMPPKRQAQLPFGKPIPPDTPDTPDTPQDEIDLSSQDISNSATSSGSFDAFTPLPKKQNKKNQRNS